MFEIIIQKTKLEKYTMVYLHKDEKMKKDM